MKRVLMKKANRLAFRFGLFLFLFAALTIGFAGPSPLFGAEDAPETAADGGIESADEIGQEMSELSAKMDKFLAEAEESEFNEKSIAEEMEGLLQSEDIFEVEELTVERLAAPEGIDTPKPRFSWKIDSSQNNESQSAYQLTLRKGSQSDKVLWTSGKVASDSQILVPYTGENLDPAALYRVELTVWNRDGSRSHTLQSQFSTGLWPTDANPNPWKGKWIGSKEDPAFEDHELPARYLAKNVSVKSGQAKAVRRACAYICGLGYYEFYLNGQKVGDHVLDPVLTEYDKRVSYNTYDVTAAVQKAQLNAKAGQDANLSLGVILGNGRFYSPRTVKPIGTKSYGVPRLLFQLEIEYKDGSRETVVSDESWKISTDGPIRENNDYDGEVCDMRKALSGKADADAFVELGEKTTPYAVALTQNADVLDAPKGKLVAQMMAPMKILEEIKPLSVNEIRPGVFIFDFGQNFVGWTRLSAQGAAGTEILLRHSETLIPDGENAGMLYYDNLRQAKARDLFILGDEKGPQTYQPRFTYHGFRYVEVTGYPGTPTLDDLTGCVVSTALPKIGEFECSQPTINQVFKNIYWGTRGNYLSIPTDCPQRDERQGWQGDRAAESKGEMYIFNNETLYVKWMQDIEDTQLEDGNVSDVCPAYWGLYSTNVTWPSAQMIIPGSLYEMFGDSDAILRHYDSRIKWLNHLAGFLKEDGTIDRDNYGDWCVPPERPELIHSEDPARKTVPGILGTAYYAYDLRLAARYADMLGKKEDAKEFYARSDAAKDALNKVYYNADKGIYDNGTQTSCVLPLYFGLVPQGEENKVFSALVNNIENVTNRHLGTGLIGGQWLNRTLSDHGRIDLAYGFATEKTYPSWGYMIEKGATTIWELWNGDTADPAMNSGNHVMLVGDECVWLFEYLAGIKSAPNAPGFKRILMKPNVVGDLTSVDATYESVRGTIASHWQYNPDQKMFVWAIMIPVNATALVSVPTDDPDSVRMTETETIVPKKAKGSRVEMELGSGIWFITSHL